MRKLRPKLRPRRIRTARIQKHCKSVEKRKLRPWSELPRRRNSRPHPQYGWDFPENSGETPETLSELFLEFPSRVRLGSPKPYNSRHLKAPEHFQNTLPPSTAGDASSFRSGSGEDFPIADRSRSGAVLQRYNRLHDLITVATSMARSGALR